MKISRSKRRFALALVVLAMVAAGCGSTASSRTSGPAQVSSGQLPPSAVLVGGASGKKTTATTIPLAKQSPTTALFAAIGAFQSCLKGLGVTFAGAPTAGEPNSPTNNPSYIKNLTTCAAKSNILQALKAEQTAQADLTPKQIAKENKIYVKWRACMISRGWVVPKATPNAQGALFSFGSSGGGGPQLTPPPGESALSSPDIQACVTLSQKGKT